MHNIEILTTNKLIDYKDSIKIMEQRIQEIHQGTQNELIWFLNHNHIYTQGTSASNKEIIKNTNIPIIKTNRGGKTTYHGPGQRIVYLMINLNKKKRDIRKFIDLIEQSVIFLLRDFKSKEILPSVDLSSADVGSSNTNISGFKYSALAMAIL